MNQLMVMLLCVCVTICMTNKTQIINDPQLEMQGCFAGTHDSCRMNEDDE